MSPLTEHEPLWEKITWVVLEVGLGLIAGIGGIVLVILAANLVIFLAFTMLSAFGWALFVAGAVNAWRLWRQERPRRPFRSPMKYSGLRERGLR